MKQDYASFSPQSNAFSPPVGGDMTLVAENLYGELVNHLRPNSVERCEEMKSATDTCPGMLQEMI
jgi:hypothetical protein